jgi:alginate O-acetyltransferase complex protein AlgI
VRYEWVAQRLRQRAFDPMEFAIGVQRFMLGFAQKVLVADPLAPLVEAGYQVAAPTAGDGALTVLAFTLQLYFEFAAYSSMAIGLGLMVGLKFVENFNTPYLSTSLAEFWRRWHISLSSWLRDYLYIPLGGNRCGVWQASLNLMITMGLGGLWHGASWTFLLWGLWHGVGLAAGRVWRALGLPALPALLGHMLTLLFVMLGWLLFRAQSGSEAALMTAGLLGQHGWGMSSALAAAMRPDQVIMLLIGVTLVYLPLRLAQRLPPVSLWLAVPLWVLALWVLHGRSVVPFLYFQF